MGSSDSYIKPNVRKLEEDKNIAGLIKALSYKNDWHVQNEARDALGRIGKLAVESLIKAIKNENEDVRRRAATSLGEIKDVRAVEPLITALKDESIRGNVAAALGKIGDSRALEPLITLLKDKDEDVRGLVAGALGEIGDIRAVEPLIALFKWDRDNRGNVAAALGEIGDARAVELLIPMLRGDTPINAEIEAEALGKIGDIRAVDPLIEVLKHSMKVPQKGRVEVIDSWALGMFDPQTKNVLSSMIDHMASTAISTAAKALGDIGDNRAIGPLEELTQNVSDKGIRQVAKEALAKLRGK